MLTMTGPGVIVRRPSVVPLALALVVTVGLGVFGWATFHDGAVTGKATSKAGLVAMFAGAFAVAELIALLVVVRYRARGLNSYAIDDTRFEWVGADGSRIGPVPLASIQSVYVADRGVPVIGTDRGVHRLTCYDASKMGSTFFTPGSRKHLCRTLASHVRKWKPDFRGGD